MTSGMTAERIEVQQNDEAPALRVAPVVAATFEEQLTMCKALARSLWQGDGRAQFNGQVSAFVQDFLGGVEAQFPLVAKAMRREEIDLAFLLERVVVRS